MLAPRPRNRQSRVIDAARLSFFAWAEMPQAADPMESEAAPGARAGTTAPCILQVLPALDEGGVERGTLDVARYLMRQGWRALVASSV